MVLLKDHEGLSAIAPPPDKRSFRPGSTMNPWASAPGYSLVKHHCCPGAQGLAEASHLLKKSI
jgi:hypothetical protein